MGNEHDWPAGVPLIDPTARRLSARRLNWWRVVTLLLFAASSAIVIYPLMRVWHRM